MSKEQLYLFESFILCLQLLTCLCFWCFHYATDDVDTRAITRRLRNDGSLIGVLSTEESKTDEELLEMSCSWNIVGKNMLQLMEGTCGGYRK